MEVPPQKLYRLAPTRPDRRGLSGASGIVGKCREMSGNGKNCISGLLSVVYAELKHLQTTWGSPGVD